MMSFISRDFFHASPVMWLPVIALLVFFALFTIGTVRALRRSKVEIDRVARLPLEHGHDD